MFWLQGERSNSWKLSFTSFIFLLHFVIFYLFNPSYCSTSRIQPQSIQWIIITIAATWVQPSLSLPWKYILLQDILNRFPPAIITSPHLILTMYIKIMSCPMASCWILNKIQTPSYSLQSLHDLDLPTSPISIPSLLPHTLSFLY